MPRSDLIRLFCLSLLWGGAFILVAIALQGLPALSVVMGRVGLAAVILALALALRGVPLPPRQAVPALLVMGLLNNAVPFTLFALAQGQIGGGLAAIVNATTPLWTVIVAHLATTDERLTPARLAGVATGFAGVVVMAGRSSGGEVWAIIACLGAALSYGCASVWGRRFRAMGLVPAQTALGQLIASSLMILPVWLLVDHPWALPFPGWGPLAAVGVLAAASTAFAYLLFFRILAGSGAVAISLVTFLIPVSAVAMGVAFLGESLLPRHLAGMALIAAGLWFLQRRRA